MTTPKTPYDEELPKTPYDEELRYFIAPDTSHDSEWLKAYKKIKARRDGYLSALAGRLPLVDALVAALRGLIALRGDTEMTYEAAYYAMFESDGAAVWSAALAALERAEKEQTMSRFSPANPKPFEQITKEDFQAYEDVRTSGVVNMYSSEVQFLAGIDKATHLGIIRHYSALRDKWPREE